MSLLEAFCGLVILGVSAVGFLDLFRAGASSLQRGTEWAQTVAIAESAMEAASLGDALQAQGAMPTPPEGYTSDVTVRPYGTQLNDVVVTVRSPRGTTFTLHRLVRSR